MIARKDSANSIGHRAPKHPQILVLEDGRKRTVRGAMFSPLLTTLLFVEGPSDTYRHGEVLTVLVPRYVVNVRPKMGERWYETVESDDLDTAVSAADDAYRAGNYDALVWDRSLNGWAADSDR